MQWTKSQSALIEKAMSNRVRAGLSVDIVMCDYGTGVREVSNYLARETARGDGARALHLTAAADKAWEVVQKLEVFSNTSESSYGKSLCASFKTLSNDGARPLALLVDRVEHMEAREMERLVLNVEWAADALNLPVQLFLFIKRLKHCVREMNEHQRPEWKPRLDFPALPELFQDRLTSKRFNFLHFAKHELEQLTKREARAEVARLAVA